MTKTEIRAWLVQEFQPLTLATVTDTIDQMIDNSFRYWNTHSAHKILRMYDSAGEGKPVTLDTDIKNVLKVYPASSAGWVLEDHPLWSLLGVTILDNLTSDLIMLAESYRNYKIYLGKDFTWTFAKSEDPSVGGQLFLLHVPSGSDRVCVAGAKRILATEDVKEEHILDWLLNYSKALLKLAEGNILRKSDIIGVNNDGQVMVDEGVKEKEELQKRLAAEGRWAAFGKRV